VLCFEG